MRYVLEFEVTSEGLAVGTVTETLATPPVGAGVLAEPPRARTGRNTSAVVPFSGWLELLRALGAGTAHAEHGPTGGGDAP